jgi:hypothetical protein
MMMMMMMMSVGLMDRLIPLGETDNWIMMMMMRGEMGSSSFCYLQMLSGKLQS